MNDRDHFRTPPRRARLMTFIVLSLVLAGAGCPGVWEVAYGGDLAIPLEPPAPQLEAIPQAPYEDAVWVAGYWSWTGVRYVWLPGRYVRRPGPGLFWYPGGYVFEGGRYVFVSGRWGPRGYRPTFHYHHPRSYPPSGGGYYYSPGKKKRRR